MNKPYSKSQLLLVYMLFNISIYILSIHWKDMKQLSSFQSNGSIEVFIIVCVDIYSKEAVSNGNHFKHKLPKGLDVYKD